MTWAAENAARIRREGAAMTREQAEKIAHKFRTEIGGVYEYIAAAIERDHKDAP